MLLLAVALAGCVASPTGTAITPEYFRFVTVTEPRDGGGGWREVGIRARMSQDLNQTGVVTQYVCTLGVGVPILLRDGRLVHLREAQEASAKAANAAAYSVLTSTVGVSAAACEAVRKKMDVLLDKAIKGSRVHGCRSVIGGVRVPVVDFP